MSTKISSDLQQHVEEAGSARDLLPVIVTLEGSIEVDELKSRGLKVDRTFDSIDAVSGSVAVADLETLAGLDAVVSIEYDGEIRAL